MNSQPIGQLVIFRTYSQRIYHQSFIMDSDNFLKIYSNKDWSIINRLDSERLKQIKSNRKRLVPIIDCIILCGSQEIALRGHNDSGSLYNSESIIDSKLFTVLADETSNISVVEQLALCVRYVDKNKNVNEVFFKFFPVQILTGKHLADSILNGLMSCGVDCNYLCGQGCDGASNMASHVSPCLCQR
ncbi:hypothetical protein AGLY_013235 [Aphis glycines]|uniref:DUF4371 domain-containing protein n=1 Tax=Aphis glycines TaxID=307491 RepID=A0A6G0T5X1_APHGL|nr:hypothetical protein AGLY_013235 [Aphis glycines]